MSDSAMELLHSDDAVMTSPEPGLRRQVMSYTPSMMLVRHKMEKGWVGAKHSHPHEQMIYVVSGLIVFEQPSGKVEVRAGDSLMVAGGVEHQAWALEDSEVLDVFTPYRADYAPQA